MDVKRTEGINGVSYNTGQLLEKIEERIGGRQVLSVIEKYNEALDMLDAYDHQTLSRPKGNEAIYGSPTRSAWKPPERCGSATNQTYSGGKTTNLLYFVTKNHSFYDGNERIATIMFLSFLDKTRFFSAMEGNELRIPRW